MVENHKLLSLDCEGEKRVQNRLERKEKELIGFQKREFNVGYHVVKPNDITKIVSGLVVKML